MYSLYKYHEILSMEEEYEDVFRAINPCEKIDILPPVLKHYKGKLVLAFLVIPQPQNNNRHLAVYRPIGAILRKLKSRKIVKIVNCAEEEFAPKYNDFSLEFYDLESHPDYWPNRSPENEEKFRVALEKLLKLVQTSRFGVYRKKLYQDYLDMVYSMFSPEYLLFFDAIAKNQITPLDESLLYQRELAKKEHTIKMQKLKDKFADDTAYARQKFIGKMKTQLQFFIRKEILPTLKNKPGYTKLDFYKFTGKLYKDIITNDSAYIGCYDATLTVKAQEENLEELIEKSKVSLIKTYAKACVNPINTDDAINDVSNEIIKFMDTMLLQEVTNSVTQKSKDIIKITIIKIERMIGRLPNTQSKQIITEIYEEVKNDYFNGLNESEMSNTYLGCMLTDIVI